MTIVAPFGGPWAQFWDHPLHMEPEDLEAISQDWGGVDELEDSLEKEALLGWAMTTGDFKILVYAPNNPDISVIVSHNSSDLNLQLSTPRQLESAFCKVNAGRNCTG